jgi:hypothetical protein
MNGMLIPTNGNPVEIDIEEVIAIRMGQRREEARSEDGRVTLKGEAQASRAASEKLAEGRDTGSPALDDHSIV